MPPPTHIVTTTCFAPNGFISTTIGTKEKAKFAFWVFSSYVEILRLWTNLLRNHSTRIEISRSLMITH